MKSWFTKPSVTKKENKFKTIMWLLIHIEIFDISEQASNTYKSFLPA